MQLKAEGDNDIRHKKIYKTNGQPNYTKFNINNFSTFIFNDGQSDISTNGNSGFIYPKGSNKAMFYRTGFVWGGKVNDEIRVGGSTYNSGLVPGKILENGAAENPILPNVRIYKVRPDYKTSNFSEEIEYQNDYKYVDGRYTIVGRKPITDTVDLKSMYERDWYEWPANDGAPFDDIDRNGIYNPDIDIPGIPGADQTIWFVANDLDENQTKLLYGSPPIGIEMQATIWGYNDSSPLKDAVFRKYIVINKSNDKIEDMYFSLWSDSEIGDASNDLVGCDTLLNMTFAYNGYDNDATYGKFIPACGFLLLQGPIINAGMDYQANFLGRLVPGKKNLSMTSLNYIYKCCAPEFGDARLGDYQGSIGMYNYMQGLTLSGNPFPIPAIFGGGFTKFPLSGNPVTGEGYIDGIDTFPADRRMALGTGPFTMAAGDTQEVIYAQLVAGGEEETPRLQSLYLLKLYASFIKEIYSSPRIYKSKIEKPSISFTPLNNKVLLDWGGLENKIDKIESSSNSNFKFEGYNIYQLPSLNTSEDKYIRIATFDKINGVQKIIEPRLNPLSKEFETKVLQFGNDTGIERFISIDKDYFTGLPLNNGSPYYYIVSCYYYNNSINSYYKSYENFSDPIKVVPQSTNPGIRYESENGDKIETSHIRGTADADIDVMIVDPSLTTGHDYEINFRKNNDNKIIWDLDDITENINVLSNQKNIAGSDEYLIENGIRIIITQDENNPLTENDLYRFTTPNVTFDEKLANDDVDKINVFPNPYYGYNPMETRKFLNYVIINHLPERAVIRIYNLAGHLVRKLHKDSNDQFYLWDLQNDHRIPVGSGLYIIHIEMPDLGKAKLLKLAVILGLEIPDFY